MTRGVLDTSTLILLGRIEADQTLPSEPLITAVTLAELSVGPLVADTDEERAARQAHLQEAEADFDPLPFDSAAARSFGQVAAALRRSGRKSSARDRKYQRRRVRSRPRARTREPRHRADHQAEENPLSGGQISRSVSSFPDTPHSRNPKFLGQIRDRAGGVGSASGQAHPVGDDQ